jgi:hypothetical protein
MSDHEEERVRAEGKLSLGEDDSFQSASSLQKVRLRY